MGAGEKYTERQLQVLIKSIMEAYKESFEKSRKMTDTEYKLGKWLSAALDDPSVCCEMKKDIKQWFSVFKGDKE